MIDVRLKERRDAPTRRRHPWIFSGAIDATSGNPAPGETVRVLDAAGNPLGMGAWSPESQIAVRMWRFDEGPVDEAFLAGRVDAALAVRATMGERFATDALRLVNAEADGLPGVTVDRYGDTLVGQFTTVGAERHKAALARALLERTGAKSFYERSDVDSRAHEGLAPTAGLLAGDEPPGHIVIHEGETRFAVDVRGGQKTGFYLDQRENRRLVAAEAKGRTVLNTFCYTGGFGVAAQKAGAAAVTHVDVSEHALGQARANTELNGLAGATFLRANVFQALRDFRDRAQRFGLVVLDPPKFAETKAQAAKALRGYKDINLLGLKLVEPGGLLATFSCSGAISPADFRMMVAAAALDAHRTVRILRELRQAPDHVESITFPEGLYLKGLLCAVE